MMNFLSLEGERSFSLTLKGNNKLRALEEELRGSELFSPLIYDEMRTEIRAIPFGDYLKRYIYVNSSLSGHFREVPVKEYRQILMDTFRENGVPATIEKSKTVSSAKTSIQIGGLKASTKYYVRIRACTKNGKILNVSKWSAKKNVKTKK